jgi:hypothetical protein
VGFSHEYPGEEAGGGGEDGGHTDGGVKRGERGGDAADLAPSAYPASRQKREMPRAVDRHVGWVASLIAASSVG